MRDSNRVATVFLAVIGAGVVAHFAVATDVAALQLEAHASVTPSVVSLNGQFTVSVEVRGTNRMDVVPSLPDLGAFSRYLGRNSSTSMQMINGVTTVSLIVQYRYRAVREGTFEIGVVEVPEVEMCIDKLELAHIRPPVPCPRTRARSSSLRKSTLPGWCPMGRMLSS